MGLGGRLVKAVRGAVTRYQKPAGRRVVNAQFVDTTNQTSRTRGNSNGGNGTSAALSNHDGIRALALHPEAAGLLQTYYGFDLSSIPNLNEQQLMELVDYLRQAEWMDEHLPKLEEHFKKYIDRQVTFNQFIATVTKAGLKGAEQIDKAGLDTWLAAKGYAANFKKLGKDADIEHKKLDQEVENYFTLKEYSLEAAFKAMAAKLAIQKQEIDARPDKVQAQQEISASQKAEKERIKNLIAYGSQPIAVIGGSASTATVDIPVTPTSPNNSNRRGGGILNNLRDFFNGK